MGIARNKVRKGIAILPGRIAQISRYSEHIRKWISTPTVGVDRDEYLDIANTLEQIRGWLATSTGGVARDKYLDEARASEQIRGSRAILTVRFARDNSKRPRGVCSR